MKKVLCISYIAPCDKRQIGGCRTHNYYIKRINSDKRIRLKLLSFEFEKDMYPDVLRDMEKYNMDSDICIRKYDPISTLIRLVKNMPSKFFPWEKNGNFTLYYYLDEIKKHLRKYKQEKYEPDVIIMEWTQIVLFVNEVKKFYPRAKYIAIEHDVSFQGLKRKALEEKNSVRKRLTWMRYKRLREAELKALNRFDIVYAHNPKDVQLLKRCKLDKPEISWYAPNYARPSQAICRTVDKENPYVLFYGAMSRVENYTSAIWFVKQVMPLLDKSIRFFIVGGSPDRCLKNFESDRVVITGYVEDVSPLFSKCLCMVAPLRLGAGIKIKVLEAMAAGVPVLTNRIGIEGIIAKDGKDYIHCETPEEYAESIRKIINAEIDIEQMARNARLTIIENYDYEEAGKKLIDTIVAI